MKSICIIGAGATGLLLLLLLQDAKIDMSKIIIIDPHFDGGDLARRWTAVISNTPWSKSLNALRETLPNLTLPSNYDPSSLTPLVELASLLRTLSESALKKVTQIQGLAIQTNYDSTHKIWTTTVDSNGLQEIQSSTVIFAQGSDPKTLNLSIPSIPLEIALDVTRLKHYIKPDDRVLVFGTMHSGTLVIHNLASLGAKVHAYYKTEHPFYWDRDGVYGGIKAEAAEVADKIMSGTIPVSLISTRDTENVIRSSRDAKWVVYAIGFSPRPLQLTVNGVKSSMDYDQDTGRLTNAPAWGFGIAYPKRAPDGIHWDVSVAAFLEHMKTQLPQILNFGTTL